MPVAWKLSMSSPRPWNENTSGAFPPGDGTVGRWTIASRVSGPTLQVMVSADAAGAARVVTAAISMESASSCMASTLQSGPDFMLDPFSGRRAATALGLVLVVLLYCIPLATNLGGLDMENDEAGYSYQVDRMLETGDWMTPRAVPTDFDFVEKPPLMFWLVAGGVEAGLLPHTDVGMRALSVAFGSLGFIYVYLIGCRLQGPVAGVAAGLVLFTFNPLLYEHGLRTNNMEGPLFLSYCAGMFHFMHWIEAGARGARRLHVSIALAAF